MSTLSLPHHPAKVKYSRKKFDRFDNPSEREIPGLWFELRALADLAPEGQKAGFHRLRSMLLRNVPNHLLPRFLDNLAEGGMA